MKSYKRIIAVIVAALVLLQGAFIGIFSGALSIDGVPQPIAYYSFEDTADLGKDEMGNYNLSKVGDSALNIAPGVSGNALSLDGTALLETKPGEDFSDSLVDYTIAFWGKRDALKGGEMIAIGSGWRDNSNGMHINLNDNYFCAGMRSNNAGQWNWYQYNVTAKLDHYAVVVSDNATKLTMYINGVVVKTEVGKYTMNNPNNPFSIGGLSNGTGWIGYTFSGLIDEVMVFDRGLSAEQIEKVRASTKNAAPSLIAQYDFDDAANLGRDTLGSNDLKKVGLGALATEKGISGTALKLDGTAWLESDNKRDFTDTLQDYTVAFWAKRDADKAEDMVVVGTGWRDSTLGFHINLNNGYFCTGLRTTTNAATWGWYETDPTAKMSHYAIVVSDGGTKLTMYIDGVVVKTETAPSGKYAMNNTENPFSVGALGNGGGFGGYPFSGIIDDLRLYDGALSQEKIVEVYNTYNIDMPDPIAHYDFNDIENAGKDKMGNYDLKKIGDGEFFADRGVSGAALGFDGTAWLELDKENDFTDSLTDYSVSFWAQRDSAAVGEMVAVGSGWRDSGNGFHINLNDKYYCAGLRISETTGSWNWYETNVTEKLNLYTIVVSDNATKLTMYMNGAAIKTTVLDSGSFTMNNPDFTFAIGALSNGGGWGGYQFKGRIDEVMVYDRPLSAVQAKKLYTDLQSSIPAKKGMIAQYDFEDSENVGKDELGNYDLQNKGGVTAVDGGRSGKAAYFAGASAADALFRGGEGFSNNLEDFTITLYAKADGKAENNACLVSNGWHPNGGMSLGINQNNVIFNSATFDKEEIMISENSEVILTDAYNFYAIAVSGGGKQVDVYFNGELLSSKTLTVPINMNSGKDFVVGQSAWYGDYAFKGYIDELAIYNYGLSAEEIKEIANIAPELILPDHSKVAHYSFEDANDIGKDSLGNYNLTNHGEVTLSSSGFSGNAASFNGNSADSCLSFDGKDFTDRFSEITLNFYAKNKSDIQADNACILSTGWDPVNGISLGFCNENLLFFDAKTDAGEVVWQTSKTGVATSEGFHGYTLSVTDGGKTIAFYVDGELVKTQSYSAPIIFKGNYNLVIGSVCWYGGYLYAGEIDEMSIYNYGMNASEIAAMYGKTTEKDPTIVASYSFDQAGEIGRDSVGGYHLSNRGGVVPFADGHKGACAYFAGIDWKDSLIYEGADFLRELDAFTVSFYAKVDGDDVPDNACIISTGWDGDAKGISLGLRPKNHFFIDSETERKTVIWEAFNTKLDTKDGFHAYSVSYSSKDLELKTYVDGTLMSTVRLDSPLNLESKFNFVVGQVAWTGYVFKGWLDELNIYNKVLSEAEIKAFAGVSEVSADVGDATSPDTKPDEENVAQLGGSDPNEKPIEIPKIPDQTGKGDKDKTNSDKAISVTAIVLICVAIIAVAGGVVGAVIYMKRRKNK